MIKPSKLVSKQNYQRHIDCQVDFETLLYVRRGNHVSARNRRTLAAGGPARASRGLRRRTQPCPMDGAALLRPRELVLPDPVGIRGISSNDPWHRITSH